MHGDSLRPNDGKVNESDEGIKLGKSGGKVIDTILGDVYGITIGISVGIDLVSLDESFDRSNDDKL